MGPALLCSICLYCLAELFVKFGFGALVIDIS